MDRSCRNCGSGRATVSPEGLVAPFFLRRVHGIEVESFGQKLDRFLLVSGSRFKRRVVRWFRDWAARVEGTESGLLSLPLVRTDLRICPDCGFVGPDRDYPFDQLKGLYLDYRSETYDRDRCRYEPWYRELKDRVGKAYEEEEVRLRLVDERLARHAKLDGIRRCIDWGGGEGRFVPRSLRGTEVWILDVSGEPLADPSYRRVDAPPPGTTFQYAQVCHVLEHVGSPREFVARILDVLEPGGYLYVELPQDRTDEEVRSLVEGRADFRHAVHEHLNLFTARSLTSLATGLGLEILEVEAVEMDFGWTRARNLCGLFRVPDRRG